MSDNKKISLIKESVGDKPIDMPPNPPKTSVWHHDQPVTITNRDPSWFPWGTFAAVVGVIAVSSGIMYGANEDSGKAHYLSGDNVYTLLKGVRDNKQLLACVGRSTLRLGGHVRTEPSFTDTSMRQKNNLVPGYTGAVTKGHTVTITNPHMFKVDNPEDNRWYTALTEPNHQRVFVNHDALQVDNFHCTTPIATALERPGPLTVTN